MSSLENRSFRPFAHFWIGLFVFSVQSCMSGLYSWATTLLSGSCFVGLSSCSIGTLFVLLMVSFAVHKLMSVIRSHLFIVAFACMACVACPRRTLLRRMCEKLLSVFSSRRLTVSCLGFESVRNVEFIVVYGVM